MHLQLCTVMGQYQSSTKRMSIRTLVVACQSIVYGPIQHVYTIVAQSIKVIKPAWLYNAAVLLALAGVVLNANKTVL